MITPPYSTPAFYTAAFNKEAATEVLRIISPEFANDAAQILISSQNFVSDVIAVNECQTSVDYIADLIGRESKISFNPIYLPTTKDLSDKIEYDSDGDVFKIDGFANPFVSATMSCATEDTKFIDASVTYKQFDMPHVHEMLRRNPKMLF